MIETNFPKLTERFRFYHRGPLRAILAVDPEFAAGSGNSFLAFCESPSGADEVIVCDLGEAHLDLYSDTATTPDGTQLYLSVRSPHIGEFLYGWYYGGRNTTAKDLSCGAWSTVGFRRTSAWSKKN